MNDQDLINLKNEATVVVEKLKEIPPEILIRRPELKQAAHAQLQPFYSDAVTRLKQAAFRQISDIAELDRTINSARISDAKNTSRGEQIEQLANAVADFMVKNNFPPVRTIEQRFANRFENLGMSRDSLPESRVRRVRRFLRDHVYEKRISIEDLPESVRRGLKTGGMRP